jgi:hypothetical protein
MIYFSDNDINILEVLPKIKSGDVIQFSIDNCMPLFGVTKEEFENMYVNENN